GCFGEVIATSAPQSKAALATRISSVAMIIASSFFARRQRSQTWRRRGLFAMRWSGFPGKRVERHRAGMIPTALLICCSKNDFDSRRQILRNPIGAAAISHFIEAGPDPDGSDPRIMRALGIDLLVANQKRAGKINTVLARCLQDHSGRRLSAF